MRQWSVYAKMQLKLASSRSLVLQIWVLCRLFTSPCLPRLEEDPGEVEAKYVDLECNDEEHVPEDDDWEAEEELPSLARLPVTEQVIEQVEDAVEDRREAEDDRADHVLLEEEGAVLAESDEAEEWGDAADKPDVLPHPDARQVQALEEARRSDVEEDVEADGESTEHQDDDKEVEVDDRTETRLVCWAETKIVVSNFPSNFEFHINTACK